jgi:hypothetical protein
MGGAKGVATWRRRRHKGARAGARGAAWLSYLARLSLARAAP